MTAKNLNAFDALRLSLKLIGLAKIGITPSPRLAKDALTSIQELKIDGKLEFPETVARLAELSSPVPTLPGEQLCKLAANEILDSVHPKRNPNPKYFHPPNLSSNAGLRKELFDLLGQYEYMRSMLPEEKLRH